MKKLTLILTAFLFLIGCGIGATPTARVEDFLSKYQTVDDEVTDQLDNVVAEDPAMTTAQRDRYTTLMEKQYRDLTYTIEEEAIDGDDATVTAQVEVYDYYKTITDAEEYLANNPEEFENEEGAYDEESFIDYRLDQIDQTTEKVTYTINFTLTRNEDGNWELDNITETDRLKIHGLYDYQ